MSGDILAFLGVSALVILTPGQDTALVIRNTLSGGRRAGRYTALGVVAGQATWTLAASAGVTALLVASEPAFRAMSFAGAAYLVFLGLQALRTALFGDPTGGDEPSLSAVAAGAKAEGLSRAEPRDPITSVSPRSAFRHGLDSNLGNPKVAVFFTSLLPQFAGGDASFTTLAGLGLVFCSITLVWLTTYAWVVSSAGDVLRRAAVRRTLEGVIGAVLVGLGVRMATIARTGLALETQ